MQPTIGHEVAQLMLQLGVILIAARLGAELMARLGQTPVLGELLAGVLIGPFALGGIHLPILDAPIFPIGEDGPISTPLYALAQIGAVLLLFLIGLETDLPRFLRYAHAATLVAVGGNLLSFFLGTAVAVLFGIGTSFADPRALFLGAIVSSTSVGVSARVLADLGRLATPEATTILGGAVLDDVLGILALGLVVGLAGGDRVTPGEVGLTAARALAAFAVVTGATLLGARLLMRLRLRPRTQEAPLALSLGLALIAAFAIERAGLALILGSFAVGLGLSQSRAGRPPEPAFAALHHVIVPIFFVVTGALVNLNEAAAALGLGLVLSVAAIVGKLLGCGFPALAVGFRHAQVVRIAAGMIPRGEVALIAAAAGLSLGAVTSQVFGVAVLVVLVTTLLGSLALSAAFRGAPAPTASPTDQTRSASAPEP